MKLRLSALLVCFLCLPVHAQGTAPVGGWVVARNVKIRAQPHKTAAGLTTLHRGMFVIIEKTRNGYYAVHPDVHSRYGWVPAWSVRKMTSEQTVMYLEKYLEDHHFYPPAYLNAVRWMPVSAPPAPHVQVSPMNAPPALPVPARCDLATITDADRIIWPPAGWLRGPGEGTRAQDRG